MSSKGSSMSAKETPRHSYEEIREGAAGNVSSIDRFSKSPDRHDPFYAGGHTGERTYGLFDHMNNVADNLKAADAKAYVIPENKHKSKSQSKSK
jgi:hypothetical protein